MTLGVVSHSDAHKAAERILSFLLETNAPEERVEDVETVSLYCAQMIDRLHVQNGDVPLFEDLLHE